MSDPQAFPEGSSSESEALWKLLGTLGSTAWKLREIEKVIAAAEERGRRAGIEEAAKWMRKPDAEQMLFTLEHTGFLAPRDSGKECGHLLSRDIGAEWRCGKPKGHEGPHSGAKP